MRTYKDSSMQKMYDTLTKLFFDRSSELYHEGAQRRGAGHRCAFWDGFASDERSGNVIRGTMSWAAFQAGCDLRKKGHTTDAPSHVPHLVRGGPGRGQGRKALAESGEKMKPRQIRMTDAEWAKCLRLGGAMWVRAQLNAAPSSTN